MSVTRSDAVHDSEHVGEWGDYPDSSGVFICGAPELMDAINASDPCDCGFDGEWEKRHVWVWNDVPGHVRRESVVLMDLADRLPPAPSSEGWWVRGGWDERCPRCGDIERFDNDANRLRCFSEDADVQILRLVPPADKEGNTAR